MSSTAKPPLSEFPSMMTTDWVSREGRLTWTGLQSEETPPCHSWPTVPLLNCLFTTRLADPVDLPTYQNWRQKTCSASSLGEASQVLVCMLTVVK